MKTILFLALLLSSTAYSMKTRPPSGSPKDHGDLFTKLEEYIYFSRFVLDYETDVDQPKKEKKKTNKKHTKKPKHRKKQKYTKQRILLAMNIAEINFKDTKH